MRTAILFLCVALLLTLSCGSQDSQDATPPTKPGNLASACALDGWTPMLTWRAAQDESGIAGYLVCMDGGAEVDVGDVTRYTYELTPPAGIHTLQVRAVDGAGNVSEAASITFVTQPLDRSKILRYETADLAEGVTVRVPPGEMVVVPFEMSVDFGFYDAFISFEVAEGGTEKYIDFYVTNQCGYIIDPTDHPQRVSQLSTTKTWEPYTYYLFFGNEFCADYEKVVWLRVANHTLWTNDLELAKTELHQAQTAVVACMADAAAFEIDAAVEAWDGSPGQVTCTVDSQVCDAADYLMGETFRATYRVEKNGDITSAVNISWYGVSWDSAMGTWVKA